MFLNSILVPEDQYDPKLHARIPIRYLHRAVYVLGGLGVLLGAYGIWSVWESLPGIFWVIAGVMLTTTFAVIVWSRVILRRTR